MITSDNQGSHDRFCKSVKLSKANQMSGDDEDKIDRIGKRHMLFFFFNQKIFFYFSAARCIHFINEFLVHRSSFFNINIVISNQSCQSTNFSRDNGYPPPPPFNIHTTCHKTKKKIKKTTNCNEMN
jgi:hypothetical protein